MKKMLALAVVLFFAMTTVTLADVTAAASSAIADGSRAGQVAAGAIGSGNNISKMSTGVGIGWNCTTSGYAIVTNHTNGTKSLGSAHDSTALYVNDSKPSAAPSAADVSGIIGAGWSAL